jgi:hypothetical protein
LAFRTVHYFMRQVLFQSVQGTAGAALWPSLRVYIAGVLV